jgi:RecA-family ATPase
MGSNMNNLATLYRCVAAIPNGGGKCIEHFYEDNARGRASAEEFAHRYDKPGWGVYDCVSLLREPKRTKDSVALIEGLHADIDIYKTGRKKDEVVKQLQDQFAHAGILSQINDSGRGVHVHLLFKDPIEAGMPRAETAQRVLKHLVAHLGADPQPAHFAALMRRLGTTNSKEGGGRCKALIITGERCDLSDIEAYLDLVGERAALFPDDAHSAIEADAVPVDVEDRLAAMTYQDKDASVNATLCAVIPALIRRGTHPEDIFKQVYSSIDLMVKRDNLLWDMEQETKKTNDRILSAYHNIFEKAYDPAAGVPIWLPMEFHESWEAALVNNKRPTMSRNGHGWHIRTYGNKADEPQQAAPVETGKQDGPKAPFILRPFKPIDGGALPPREFLFGKHYQRRTVSGTVAPGGTGKSSLVMVECIAMATGRNLLEEEVKERVRVWYHNGEDNMTELERRVFAICQHYHIPQEELEGWFFMTSGNEVPLRVAESYSQIRMNINHQLIKCITDAITDNKIDVCVLDPLVTLHGVRESDPGLMDQVIRIFTRIADTQNCAIDLSHHTRKLAPGSATEDHTVDDIRGAKAISDAMRAVRMLNIMTPQDAENAGLMELERTNYFRIDRAKANYSGPAKKAVWRQFVNVDLPNGDAVGVVCTWLFPGQDGAASPQKAELERKGKAVFLEILRRFTASGRAVHERGPHAAPGAFAKEREARVAKVSKAQLAHAMRQLFDEEKIRHRAARIVEA